MNRDSRDNRTPSILLKQHQGKKIRPDERIRRQKYYLLLILEINRRMYKNIRGSGRVTIKYCNSGWEHPRYNIPEKHESLLSSTVKINAYENEMEKPFTSSTSITQTLNLYRNACGKSSLKPEAVTKRIMWGDVLIWKDHCKTCIYEHVLKKY